MKCPHCGTPLMIVAANHQLGGYRQYSTFQNAAQSLAQGQPAIDTGNWERVTPVDRLQPRDITTALYDALASFSLVSIGLTVPTLYFDFPWWVPPAGGMGVALWRYFGMMSLAMRLLEIVETITQTDLNQDGYTGPPQKHVVTVEVKADDGRWQFADLPGSPTALQAFTNDVLSGNSFSERTATAQGLTQEEFGKLRDLFIDRAWAEWNHPTRRQLGVSLNRAGLFVIRSIATTPIPAALKNTVLDSTQQHAA